MNRKYSMLFVGFMGIATSLQAFDNHREGLFFSFGVGVSQTYHKPYEENAFAGLATSQKIGYGLDDQLILHVTREDSWTKEDGDLYLSCFPGIGATYYFSKEAGSFFVSATLGAGGYNAFDDNSDKFGFGVSLALGYEIARHINAEITFMSAALEDKGDKIDPSTFKAGVSYSWY